jgi:hypothetical protein
MTFIAAGGGGTPPYQYQWRYVRIASEVTLRDWSSDPNFVWDGTVPGLASVPASAEVAELARSAGGLVAEVRKSITVLLR